jgi:hypothetical protein
MKTKSILMLGLILALLLATSVTSVANAKNALVPFKGDYITFPNIVGIDANGCNIQEIDGVGNATHLGLNTWHSDALACPGAWVQTGTITFTAANGDQLYMKFAGTFSIGPGIAYFKGDYTFTGGNGRFLHAGGTGDYWGSASLTPGGTGEIFFDGVLEK